MNKDEKHDPNLDNQNNSLISDTLLSIFFLIFLNFVMMIIDYKIHGIWYRLLSKIS